MGCPGSSPGRQTPTPPHIFWMVPSGCGVSPVARGNPERPVSAKVASVCEVKSSANLGTCEGAHESARELTRVQGAAGNTGLASLEPSPQTKSLEEGTFQSEVDLPGISPPRTSSPL